VKQIIKECQEGLEAEEEWMAGKVTNDDVSSLIASDAAKKIQASHLVRRTGKSYGDFFHDSIVEIIAKSFRRKLLGETYQNTKQEAGHRAPPTIHSQRISISQP
jgi:hypothetical protein